MKAAAVKSIIVFIFISATAFSQKNDTVYLVNGDRLTGEVKKFEYGILTFKTDAMQTVSIDSYFINTVYSSKLFEIEGSNGFILLGSMKSSQIPGIIDIVNENDTIPKPILDIVQISTIKNRFIARIDGSVNVGVSYVKASDYFQAYFNGSATYRRPRNMTRLDLSTLNTFQKSDDPTKKNDLGITYNHFLPSKWFTGAKIQAQQNTELDLQLRLQLGPGLGYDIIQSNRNRFYSLAGIYVNRELSLDSANASYSLDALLTLEYKLFRYHSPKIDFTTYVNFFPSLTIRDRYRVEYNIQANIEIVKDLFLSLTFYDNFDSSPASGSPKKNDWGITTSIGYSF